MHFNKSVTLITLVLLGSLSGCADKFIKPVAGVERVSLADASQVMQCESKGKIIASVFAKVGFITRDADEVEADLLKLAFNEAVAVAGDTIVKGEQPEFGKRAFNIYRCRS